MRLAVALMLGLLTCLGVGGVACSDAPPDQRPSSVAPTATATIPAVAFGRGTVSFTGADGRIRTIAVEVATSGEQQARGLGYRDALERDRGMLFVYPEARPVTFWMKGMRFPLDMVWIGADRRVVSVTADIPPQPGASDAELRRYAPAASVQYVLELNAGAAAELGLSTGTEIAIRIDG